MRRPLSTFPAASRTSDLIVAVSTTSDPTGICCRSRLSQPLFQDFPMLGVSDDTVVVAYNGFACADESVLGAGYHVLRKADLLACAPSVGMRRVGPDPSLVTPHRPNRSPRRAMPASRCTGRTRGTSRS